MRPKGSLDVRAAHATGFNTRREDWSNILKIILDTQLKMFYGIINISKHSAFTTYDHFQEVRLWEDQR